MFNGLVQMNPQKDGEIIGDLATSLPEQPDEMTYVFKIPPGVKFHDGTVLTSDDIKANYEWMVKPPAGKVSTRQGILGPLISKIETPDPNTIRFTLNYPSASFLVNNTVEYVAIGPKSVLTADGDLANNPVGTGPFLRKSYTPGSSVELVRNDAYFKPNLPYLDGITVHIVPDRRTALENFLAGRLHIYSPTGEQVAEIESRLSGKAKVLEQPSNARNALFMMTTRPPFNDPRVREAVSLACSRDDHFELVLQGRGAPVGGYMAPAPGGQWSLPIDEIKAISGYGGADVEKAKALLAEAGVADVNLRLVARNISESLAVFLSEQLRQVGLETSTQLLDSGAAYQAGTNGDFDILPWATVPPLDDPDAVLGDVGGYSTSSRNWSKFSDPQVDELYNRQSRTLDATERKTLVNEIDRILLGKFVTICLGYTGALFAQYDTVQNKTYHLNENYTNRTYEDIWLSS